MPFCCRLPDTTANPHHLRPGLPFFLDREENALRTAQAALTSCYLQSVSISS